MADAVAEKVIATLASVKRIPAEKITLETNLQDLGIDSSMFSRCSSNLRTPSKSPSRTMTSAPSTVNDIVGGVKKLIAAAPPSLGVGHPGGLAAALANLLTTVIPCGADAAANCVAPPQVSRAVTPRIRNERQKLEMAPRRVAITGLGIISPLGLDLAAKWEACAKGAPPSAPFSGVDYHALSCDFRTARRCAALIASKHFERGKEDYIDRFAQFSVVAAREAVARFGNRVDAGARPSAPRSSAARPSAGRRRSKRASRTCTSRTAAASIR